jgi:serine O-acetyltransferase
VFEKLRKDFERHDRRLGNPAIWVLAVYRYGRWSRQLPNPARKVADRVYHLMHLGVQLATGSFIPREVDIGDAPHLIHHFDIRIHPQVKIGDRVGLMHEVTIASTMHRVGAPTIGNDVFIGPGAKIIGPVTIGDGAVIAPNSLVLSNVPAKATAIGVPAKIRRVDLELKGGKNGKSAPAPPQTPQPGKADAKVDSSDKGAAPEAS